MSTKYPEHEKLVEVKIEKVAIGLFLDWLDEEGITLCVLRESSEDEDDEDFVDDRFMPLRERKESIIGRYFGIDLDKLQIEKEEMLAEIRGG